MHRAIGRPTSVRVKGVLRAVIRRGRSTPDSPDRERGADFLDWEEDREAMPSEINDLRRVVVTGYYTDEGAKGFSDSNDSGPVPGAVKE